MIPIEDALFALLIFLLCILIAYELLFHPDKWTRRIGNLSLWALRISPYRKPFWSAYREFSKKLAQRAVDKPESVLYYRALWFIMGIMALIFAAWILLGFFNFLIRTVR